LADLAISLGPIRLKNPLICASSEFTMTAAGIRACLAAGAAAVVAKSINESPLAARQLQSADYLLLGPDWAPTGWEAPAAATSLFCRSGLPRISLDDWLQLLSELDSQAQRMDAYVVGSITASSPEGARDIARGLGRAVRWLELNLGAPYGREAAGAVRLLTEPEQVREFVRPVRAAVDVPLTVKLSGQASDLVSLARAAADEGADMVALMGRFPAFLPDLETLGPVLGSWGAIGGGWALPITLYWLSRCRRALGPTLPLIGTNGARSGLDLARFLLSGAHAVQIATALLTHGPACIPSFLAELAGYLDRKGITRVDALVGLAADRAAEFSELPPRPPEAAYPWERFLGGEGGRQ
jgi:dihydroorotate dehydrogenase (NAD+) catalytic subunit